MDKWLTLEVIVKWEPRISVRLKMIPALMNVIRFITVRTILDFISFLLVMYTFSSYPSFLYILCAGKESKVCLHSTCFSHLIFVVVGNKFCPVVSVISLLDQLILWLKVGGQHWIFVGGGVGCYCVFWFLSEKDLTAPCSRIDLNGFRCKFVLLPLTPCSKFVVSSLK